MPSSMQGDGHFGKQDSVLYSDVRGREKREAEW